MVNNDEAQDENKRALNEENEKGASEGVMNIVRCKI